MLKTKNVKGKASATIAVLGVLASLRAVLTI